MFFQLVAFSSSKIRHIYLHIVQSYLLFHWKVSSFNSSWNKRNLFNCDDKQTMELFSLNTFPDKEIWHLYNRKLLKIVRKKKKLLKMSKFSFSTLSNLFITFKHPVFKRHIFPQNISKQTTLKNMVNYLPNICFHSPKWRKW